MTSKAPISRSVVIKSTASAISEPLRWVLDTLKACNFSQDDIFAVHLSLQEAFLNAIRHGNKIDASKEVKIDYLVSLEKVEISMTDEGNGFDPDAVPDPRIGDNLYKTEGRGLFLMRSYMDVVEFSEAGNVVRMVRYKRPGLTEAQSKRALSES